MNRRHFLEMLALSGLGLALRPEQSRAAEADLQRPGVAGVAPTAEVRPGAEAPHPVVGMNTNTYHWREQENIDHLALLGIRHVRVTGILQFWEGEVPSYRAYMQESAELAHKNGVRLLWVLHNSRGDVFSTGVDRRWWERMASFAAWTARLPAVEGVQLWNEQDVWVQSPFGAGARPRLSAEGVGRNYARFLRYAYPRIKKANPRVQVVSGGTADHPDERWRGFMVGMMESNPSLDVVGVHAYGPWNRARGIVQEVVSTVAGQAPVWLTECGNDRPERFDPAYQLTCWRTVVEGNARERLVERVYPYTLPTDPGDPGHGLFHVAGGPRPAYRWLRDWMRER